MHGDKGQSARYGLAGHILPWTSFAVADATTAACGYQNGLGGGSRRGGVRKGLLKRDRERVRLDRLDHGRSAHGMRFQVEAKRLAICQGDALKLAFPLTFSDTVSFVSVAGAVS